MDQQPITAPSALSHSQFSPSASALHPPSVQHNIKVLGQIATLTACFAGLVAGIIGLTNWTGFALYLATSVLSGVTVAAVKCHGDVAKYSPWAHAGAGPQGASETSLWKGWLGITGMGQENLLGFLLFWIGGYALMHVYD